MDHGAGDRAPLDEENLTEQIEDAARHADPDLWLAPSEPMQDFLHDLDRGDSVERPIGDPPHDGAARHPMRMVGAARVHHGGRVDKDRHDR